MLLKKIVHLKWINKFIKDETTDTLIFIKKFSNKDFAKIII